MLKKEIRQQKQINNRPVKSPSPDNLSKNRNIQTLIELHEAQFNIKTSNNVSPSKFPAIPYDLILKKKKRSEEENQNPTFISPGVSKDEKECTTPTAKPKSQKKNPVKIPQISNFQVSMNEDSNDHQFSQILYGVSEIYSLINDRRVGGLVIKGKNNSKENLKDYLQKLEMIKQKVFEWVCNQKVIENKGKTFKQHVPDSPQFYNKNDSIMYSPIKKQYNDQQSQLSLLQTNEIQNQNNFLRRQIAMLKIELENGRESRNMEREIDGIGQQNKGSIWNKQKESEKLLRQKVNYLQNELEDKINKLIDMERSKNEEIQNLKQNAQIMNQNQMEASNKIIRNLQTQIHTIQSSPKYKQEQPIHIFTSEKKHVRKTSENFTFLKPERKNTETVSNRLSMKKGLPWDKEQIVSIYDKQRHPDEDQYSEAERVDIQNLFATKRQLESQIERMKEIYEQKQKLIVNKNESDLHKLQQELRQIKKYIQQCVKEDDENDQSGNRIEKSILMTYEFERSEFEKEINLMKKQVQYERKENQQLRNLIYKIHNPQISNVCPTQKKRKGAQKLTKSFAKSEKIRNDTSNTYNSFEEDIEQEYQ